MNFLNTSVHLDGGDVDRADIYTLDTLDEVCAVVRFDGLTILPARGENLAGLLRALADRIDTVTAGDPGPVLSAVA